MSGEEYIPSARDAIVGYFGRTASGVLRSYCVTCNDKLPLGGYDGHGPDRVYGDLYVASGRLDRMTEDGACDECGVTFLSLSESCQREHDEQQTRWARGPITHVVEMGMVGAVRCRIY